MKIQQGDVLLTKITPEEWNDKVHNEKSKESTGFYNADTKDSKATVALGEATGHHHSVTGGDGFAQSWFVGWRASFRNEDDPLRSNYLHVGSTDVEMTHQEHNPVTIPAGYYSVKIVREFDHMSQNTRMVVD